MRAGRYRPFREPTKEARPSMVTIDDARWLAGHLRGMVSSAPLPGRTASQRRGQLMDNIMAKDRDNDLFFILTVQGWCT